MPPRTKPTSPSAADTRPIRINRPRLATDPDALGLDLAARVAAAHTTIDDRIVALGLDMAPLSGYAYALVDARQAVRPEGRLHRSGPARPKGGDWDTGATIFVRLRTFLEVLRPAVIFYREFPGPPAVTGGRAGAVAITAGRKADDAIRVALKETLTDWAERCSVPCRSFDVGGLKRRYTGRGVASKADLVGPATSGSPWTWTPTAATSRGSIASPSPRSACSPGSRMSWMKIDQR